MVWSFVALYSVFLLDGVNEGYKNQIEKKEQ